MNFFSRADFKGCFEQLYFGDANQLYYTLKSVWRAIVRKRESAAAFQVAIELMKLKKAAADSF